MLGHPIKKDDLGVTLFQETSIWIFFMANFMAIHIGI